MECLGGLHPSAPPPAPPPSAVLSERNRKHYNQLKVQNLINGWFTVKHTGEETVCPATASQIISYWLKITFIMMTPPRPMDVCPAAAGGFL